MIFLDPYDTNHTACTSVGGEECFVSLGSRSAIDSTIDRLPAARLSGPLGQAELVLAVDPFASWFDNVRRDELIAGRILPANAILSEPISVDQGKPLVMVLYTGAQPAEQMPGLPVDTSGFTVRYVGTQLQATHVDQFGHWSWMDGVAEPIVTYANGRAEAVTPTAAFFALDLAGVAHGAHVASVVAEGAVTRYPLARDRMDARLRDAVPVRVDIPFSFIKNAL